MKALDLRNGEVIVKFNEEYARRYNKATQLVNLANDIESLEYDDDTSDWDNNEIEYFNDIDKNAFDEIDVFLLATPLAILKKDGCTENEAKKYLNDGTQIFESEQDFWEDIEETLKDEDDEDIQRALKADYDKLVASKEPISVGTWSKVIYKDKIYYISYVL